MGPVDDNFFEGIKSSLPKSPKVVKQNSANHQLMRKIGQLQVEVEEYKRVIKTMTDEMERLKMNWTQKLGLKEQQIKLCRDEALLLRARINQKDEQIIGLGNTRNEGKELREKNERLGNELNEVKVGLSEKSVVLGKIEEEMKQLQ